MPLPAPDPCVTHLTAARMERKQSSTNILSGKKSSPHRVPHRVRRPAGRSKYIYCSSEQPLQPLQPQKKAVQKAAAAFGTTDQTIDNSKVDRPAAFDKAISLTNQAAQADSVKEYELAHTLYKEAISLLLFAAKSDPQRKDEYIAKIWGFSKRALELQNILRPPGEIKAVVSTKVSISSTLTRETKAVVSTKVAISSTVTPTALRNPSTVPCRASFYGNSFTRPSTIPADIFSMSVTRMNNKISRNPYDHWKKETDYGFRPDCKHEIVQPWADGWDPASGWSTRKRWVCMACQMDLTETRLDIERRLADAAQAEDRLDSSSETTHANFLHKRGIRIDALLAFAFDHDCWDWPTWQIVRDIIQPGTADGRCRYSDLPELAPFFKPADVFISHCWGSKFGDTVAAACHGARLDRTVWLDIFTVRQWPGNFADVAFRPVIGKCKATIVSLPVVEELAQRFLRFNQKGGETFLSSPSGMKARATIPFFRLWCVVEIASALQCKRPIVVKGGRVVVKRTSGEEASDELNQTTCTYNTECVGKMMQNLMHMIDIEKSGYTVRADYDREMAIVRNTCGVDQVNKVVAGVVTGAVTSIMYDISAIDAWVCGEPEALRYLEIRSGAKDDKERNLAMVVLKVAGAGGRIEIVRKLLRRWGTREIHAEWLKDLVDQSLILWVAASGGHLEIFKLLLSEVAGINLNVASSSGATALYVACDNGHTAVVNCLLQEKDKIDINQPTNKGNTPLHIGAQNGNAVVVGRLLEENSIDVNVCNEVGSTPLSIAGDKGYAEVVRLLENKSNGRYLYATEQDPTGNTKNLKVGDVGTSIDLLKNLKSLGLCKSNWESEILSSSSYDHD